MSAHLHTHDNHHHPHSHELGGHVHTPENFGRAFLIGTLLNVGFVVIEATYGILSNSMALLADAGHNLSDVLGLLVAWAAATLSRRAPSAHYTYGMGRSSILAALFNAVFLLLAIGAIAFQAIERLIHPEPVQSTTVMAVATVGIFINGITAWLFARGRKGDINIRGAFLHMLTDALVSAGVVIAGFITLQTGWQWLDPMTSLFIVAIILISTWGLLRDSMRMSLDRVPLHIVPSEVETALEALPGVARVHDLHIWSMSTTDIALTCHIVMPDGCPGDAFLHNASAMLHDKFNIGHATLQVEREDAEECELAHGH
jgi:cobalt-zinc-cadmium efflux system protein